MLTRCPRCQTFFRVDADTLNIAQGQVRCGRCAVQFNALDNLLEQDLPAIEVAADAQAGAQANEVECVSTAAGVTDGAAQETAASELVVSSPAEQSVQPAPLFIPGEVHGLPVSTAEAPVLTLETIQQALFIEDQAQPRSSLRYVGGFLILALLALLAGQWLYMQRVPLYDRPFLRPALEHFCTVLGCDLPLLHLPERIQVLDRSVQEHPRDVGALLATISFVSRADRPIAYPQVVMQLGDISGNRMLSRRFTPAEYLPPGVDMRAGMLPGRAVQITLELVEPEMKVVSFYFDFY